jgi:hypothetical protein
LRVSLLQTGQAWFKELAGGDKAVVLYNNGTNPVQVDVTWPQIGWYVMLSLPPTNLVNIFCLSVFTLIKVYV